MKILKIIIIGLLIVSCTAKNETNKIKSAKAGLQVEISKAITDTISNATGAYLNLDKENNIFLNWTEEIDSSKVYILKYRRFDNVTKQFGETVTVASSKGMQIHSESMAKVAITSEGILYAIFRIEDHKSKRRFAGNIYYSISTDNGENWSKKTKLVVDKESKSQSFFDVAVLPDGELGLSWLDSRKLEKDKDGSTLYFAKSNNDKGFVNEKPVAGSTCQCCRTDIFVDENNKINIAYRNITEGSIRDMYRVVSADNGITFSDSKRMGIDNWKIDGCPHTGPSFADNSQDLAVTWFTGADSSIGIFFKKLTSEVSIYNEKTLLTSVGSHPQMVALSNGNFYIVYEEFYKFKNKFLSNIVLHVINSDGTEIKKIISNPNTSNNHAVISKLNGNKLLVAWVKKNNKKSNIVYTIVDCS